MATILGIKGQVLNVNADPSAGAGTPSPIGTIAITTAAVLYTKTGAADTAWTIITSGSAIASGGLLNIRVFTAGVSYTPTALTTEIYFMLLAGGGGGGGASGVAANAAAGSGGGAGGWLSAFVTGVGAGPFTYAIGAGGAAGAAAAGNGGNGGNTSITVNAVLYATNGGNGGTGQAAGTTAAALDGGTGGTISTNGLVNGAGDPGDYSFRTSGTFAIGGKGGSSAYGRAGLAQAQTAGSGNAAIGFGAGGSGSMTVTNANRAGGAGTGGFFLVWEYL